MLSNLFLPAGYQQPERVDLFFLSFLQLNEHANLQKRGKNGNDSIIYESKVISVNQCQWNGQKDIQTSQVSSSSIRKWEFRMTNITKDIFVYQSLDAFC